MNALTVAFTVLIAGLMVISGVFAYSYVQDQGKINSLQGTNSDLAGKLASAEQGIHSLSSQVSADQSRMANDNQTISSAGEQMHKDNITMAAFSMTMSRDNGTIASLNGNVTNLSIEVSNYQAQVAMLTAENSSNTKEISMLEKNISVDQSTIANDTLAIGNLTSQVSSLEENVTSLQSQISDDQAEIVSLQSDVSSLNNEVLSLEYSISSLSSEASSLESEIGYSMNVQYISSRIGQPMQWFTATTDTQSFYRSTTPITSGNVAETMSQNGTVRLWINNTAQYNDAGIYYSYGSLGQLIANAPVISGKGFVVNLWINEQDWTWNGNTYVSLGTDGAYGFLYVSNPDTQSGTITINGNTQYFALGAAAELSLSGTLSNIESTLGSNTPVSLYIGIDSFAGSVSATVYPPPSSIQSAVDVNGQSYTQGSISQSSFVSAETFMNFSVSNFAPGDYIEYNVTITNNGPHTIELQRYNYTARGVGQGPSIYSVQGSMTAGNVTYTFWSTPSFLYNQYNVSFGNPGFNNFVGETLPEYITYNNNTDINNGYSGWTFAWSVPNWNIPQTLSPGQSFTFTIFVSYGGLATLPEVATMNTLMIMVAY